MQQVESLELFPRKHWETLVQAAREALQKTQGRGCISGVVYVLQ
jgi:hypothetical protein